MQSDAAEKIYLARVAAFVCAMAHPGLRKVLFFAPQGRKREGKGCFFSRAASAHVKKCTFLFTPHKVTICIILRNMTDLKRSIMFYDATSKPSVYKSEWSITRNAHVRAETVSWHPPDVFAPYATRSTAGSRQQ